jgi:dihydrolipoamide dehydrogenase
VKLNLGNMMLAKEKSVSTLTRGIEGLFKKNKVAYEVGHGRIVTPTSVEVVGAGGRKVINTKNIIIATGSDVSSIPALPIDEERIVSSTGALSLKAVPPRMLVVGGGVIGLELGSVWARLGSRVTVIEYLDHICGNADLELARMFQRILAKQGIEFKLKSKVVACSKGPNAITLTTEPAEGGASSTHEAEVVLVSVGRRPYTDGLGLEGVGVRVNKRGQIETNEHWQTNISNIYAIGDVITGPMLAHKAEEEGIAVIENLVSPGVGHVNYNAIPSVIYTHPEFAWVGATEEDLKQSGVAYKKGVFPMQANSRAKTINDTDGMIKFLVDANTNRLLGAHLLCASAGEMITECTLGIEYGASGEDLARTCHPHPTLSEALKEAALGTFVEPIHI